MYGAPCVLLILPGRPAVDERAPRAGLVCYAAPFRPCWVRGLSAHQRCSISTGRYQRPPCNPGVGGGSVWRSVHATATAVGAIVEMTSR